MTSDRVSTSSTAKIARTDLVQPRGEAPAYAARRSVAIDKYRQGQDPSGTYTGYDKGKISDLGK
jgi:pilus assembly protein CpaD